MKRFWNLLHTENQLTGFILRLTLATVIFPHGAQMAFGWFDGFGFSATMIYLTQTENLPWLVSLPVILMQVLFPVMLLIGLATRLVAIGLIGLFIGMVLTSHLDYGFFMNWLGTQKGEGFEYHLLAIGMSVTLLITGGGRYSLDRRLT